MMAGKLMRICLVYLIAAIVCGCAAFLESASETKVLDDAAQKAAQLVQLRSSVEKYRSLALAAEKDQQIYKAVFIWGIVRDISPDDRQALQKIEELEEKIRRGADRHILKGKNHIRQKSYAPARNEFLKALAYDANRQDVLEWLRYHSVDEGYATYETKPGDTAKAIAQKVYGDAGKDFIVAYFAPAAHNEAMAPQTPLKLPLIESPLPQPELKPRPKSKYKAAAVPEASRAEKVVDKAGAENHYRKGVSFFLAEDIHRAAREWEEALKLDPEHQNARRNLDKARKLLKNGRGK